MKRTNGYQQMYQIIQSNLLIFMHLRPFERQLIGFFLGSIQLGVLLEGVQLAHRMSLQGAFLAEDGVSLLDDFKLHACWNKGLPSERACPSGKGKDRFLQLAVPAGTSSWFNPSWALCGKMGSRPAKAV